MTQCPELVLTSNTTSMLVTDSAPFLASETWYYAAKSQDALFSPLSQLESWIQGLAQKHCRIPPQIHAIYSSTFATDFCH